MKLTAKCPLNTLILVAGGEIYNLSSYASKEEAWEDEKEEWWVEGAETLAQAREEFMSSLYEYSPEEVVAAALDDQAWPFDWGFVKEQEL
jgi:hypothetical protein